MMSIERSEIGANIRNYIDLNKALEIEGLGRLVKVESGARLQGLSHVVHPSSSEIILTKGSGVIDTDFETYLSVQNNLYLSEAKALYKKFSAELNYDLAQKGSVVVRNVGQFSMVSGSIIFKESANFNLISDAYGLPSVRIKPLKIVRSESQPKPRAEKVKNLPKQDYSDRNFLLSTAAIAACFLLVLFAYHNLFHTASQPDFTSINVDQQRLNMAPDKVLVNDYFEIPAPVIEDKVVEVEKVTSCALIIGSFSKQANAIELQQKVLEAGYELFTEEFHEFYRVGVSFDCSKIQGGTFREIEQALGVDPWLRIVQ